LIQIYTKIKAAWLKKTGDGILPPTQLSGGWGSKDVFKITLLCHGVFLTKEMKSI
jgi:hypothetical protein